MLLIQILHVFELWTYVGSCQSLDLGRCGDLDIRLERKLFLIVFLILLLLLFRLLIFTIYSVEVEDTVALLDPGDVIFCEAQLLLRVDPSVA